MSYFCLAYSYNFSISVNFNPLIFAISSSRMVSSNFFAISLFVSFMPSFRPQPTPPFFLGICLVHSGKEPYCFPGFYAPNELGTAFSVQRESLRKLNFSPAAFSPLAVKCGSIFSFCKKYIHSSNRSLITWGKRLTF